MLYKHIPAQPPREVPCSLAFVAEAPGDTEVVRGTPLCGPSGKQLNEVLRRAGVERGACWVGNVFDEQMPGNSIKSWCQREREDAEGLLPFHFPGAGYLRREFHWHFERLAQELSAAQPRVIVPLGGTALWAFTGSSAIGDARGAVHRASLIVPGAKLLPTFHPAFILRQYKMQGTMVADIKKAAAEALNASDVMTLSPRTLWLDPTLRDIAKFHDRYLRTSKLISIDIETAVNQITKIGFSADSEHAICIPFVDYRRPNRSYWSTLEEELAAWAWVQIICRLSAPKLFQNGPFDCWHLIRNGIKIANWREDTRLLHHALYPELPKSLAYMGSTYAKQGPWKMLGHHGKAKRDE